MAEAELAQPHITTSHVQTIFIFYVCNDTCANCHSGWHLLSDFVETFSSVIEFPLVVKQLFIPISASVPFMCLPRSETAYSCQLYCTCFFFPVFSKTPEQAELIYWRQCNLFLCGRQLFILSVLPTAVIQHIVFFSSTQTLSMSIDRRFL